LFSELSVAGEVTPTAAPFLEIDASPRNAALGGSGFAMPGGLHSTQWNPAGLAEIDGPYAGLMHSAWFEGLSLEWASYAADLGASNGAAVSATFLRSDALPRYDEFGTPAGEFRVYDAAVTAAFGHSFGPAFSGGLAVKGIRQSVDDESTLGAAADMGLMWRTNAWRAGFVAQNFGPKMGYGSDKAPLPSSYAAGVAAPFMNRRLWLSGAAVFPTHYHDDLRIGAEYSPIDAFALRAGYRHVLGQGTDDQLTGFSYGLGFQLPQVRIDYAYRPYSDLGDTHQFGLALAVGRSMRPVPETPQKLPPPRQATPVRAEAPEAAKSEKVPPVAERAPLQPPVSPGPAVAVAPPATAPTAAEPAVESPVAAAPQPVVENPAPAPAEPAEAAPRFAVIAGIHRSRLSALIELRSLRESGLSGGEIIRAEDARYHVVLERFESAERAAEWIAKRSGDFGGQAFQVVRMP